MVEILKKAPKISGDVEKSVEAIKVWPESIDGGDQTRYNGDKDMAANYGHTEASINKLVESFEKVGQLEPVVCRVVDDKLHMLAGFGRWVAMTVYNGKHPDAPMRLDVRAVKCSDEEALMISETENRLRDETTPLDDAHAQHLFRTKLGWNNAQIAAHFGCDSAMVTRLKRIYEAPEKVKAFVHAQLLPIITAYEIAGLDKKQQDEVMRTIVRQGKDVTAKWKQLDKFFKEDPEAVPQPSPEPTKPAKGGKGTGGKGGTGKKRGKGTAARVARKAVRGARQATAESNGQPADDQIPAGFGGGEATPEPAKRRTTSKSLGLDEIKDFFASLTGPAEDKAVSDFGDKFLQWASGKMKELDWDKYVKTALTGK